MRWLAALAAVALVGLLGWAAVLRLTSADGDKQAGPAVEAAPVRVAEVVVGPIELRRTYSGTLEARAEFVVAPKIAGRVNRIAVEMSDPVERGQVVAELDDAEYEQALAQAEADLAVASATVTDATNALEIARREYARLRSLREQNIASDSQVDGVEADLLSKEGAYAVATAQVTRAQASLEGAKIRLGYTRVTASWSGSDRRRVVGERFVDEGVTISANTPLMSIVSLDPIAGVVFATEQDYANLRVDQPVELRTDAYGERTFTGSIRRIAPVFQQNSRQARVELTIDNPGNLLKPGMFVRAEVVLGQVPDATIVPLDALVTRDGGQGVFVVDDAAAHVRWHPVELGIRDGKRVQIVGERITGRIVTLGQQLIDDGSRIVIPDDQAPETPP